VLRVKVFSPGVDGGRTAITFSSVLIESNALAPSSDSEAPARNDPVIVILPPDVEIDSEDRDEITGSGSYR
jgi:hypothetical protein